MGNILSINNKKAPPNKNPIAAGNHAISSFLLTFQWQVLTGNLSNHSIFVIH
jgi:hypothetical protein